MKLWMLGAAFAPAAVIVAAVLLGHSDRHAAPLRCGIPTLSTTCGSVSR